MMNWHQLLSASRPKDRGTSIDSDTRSRFDQDYDRVVFSYPFRRLQDKTQVFPLPEDDFVHNRLTHSLEVSVVARSLGKEVGKKLIEKYTDLSSVGFSFHDFGSITSTAALAHDLGNPPFGHSGEAAISAFFSKSPAGKVFQNKIKPEKWADLCHFEGNAQGFRILNSFQFGKVRLTHATLGAFTKYPRTNVSEKIADRKSQKKFGVYLSELSVFEELARQCGLISLSEHSWCRHPLAFLVEAADDICYHIIDIEDGVRLGLLDFNQVEPHIRGILGPIYDQSKVAAIPTVHEKISVLRALMIQHLVTACTEVFLEKEEEILKGIFDQSLTSCIPQSAVLSEIIQLSVDKLYKSQLVFEKEASGFEAIDTLLNKFTQAVYTFCFDKQNHTPRNESIIRLLPSMYQVSLKKDLTEEYEALQLVVDFVSGLTDRSALRLHRMLSGYT